MKRTALLAVAFTVSLVCQALSQTPGAVLVQSFRKGPTHVPEHNIVVNLDVKGATFDSKIRDSSGDERYWLSIMPHHVDVTDARITAWEVKLFDLHRKYLGNLLVATMPTEPLSDRAEDSAWRLDPNPYAAV